MPPPVWLPFDLCVTCVSPHTLVIGPYHACATACALAARWIELRVYLSNRRFYVILGHGEDLLEGQTVLLSLSELSGPGLESCVIATFDSPGLLELIWGSL